MASTLQNAIVDKISPRRTQYFRQLNKKNKPKIAYDDRTWQLCYTYDIRTSKQSWLSVPDFWLNQKDTWHAEEIELGLSIPHASTLFTSPTYSWELTVLWKWMPLIPQMPCLSCKQMSEWKVPKRHIHLIQLFSRHYLNVLDMPYFANDLGCGI